MGRMIINRKIRPAAVFPHPVRSYVPSGGPYDCPLLKIKLIPLTQGKYAIVDSWNYKWLNQWKWYAKEATTTGIYYAAHNFGRTTIRMHRIIINVPKGAYTDHANHNELDNRECNLRQCTPSQNRQNSKIRLHTSRFKGVYWNKEMKKWHARITLNRTRVDSRKIHLGYFASEIEAAKVYNKKALELFGEFAYLNFS